MISVAIDGPAGAGKSSISKMLSKELGYIYVDTGALYRTVAYSLITSGVDISDTDAVEKALPDIKVELKYIDGSQRVILNGADVSELIRTPEMSMGASKVSSIPCVRKFLLDTQRSMAQRYNIVMDGRDIGTVVLPNAEIKIYLTASAEVRAKRRHLEMLEKGMESDYDSVLSDIKQRDYSDMHRDIAPLRQADDAVYIDTSDIDFDASVKRLLDVVSDKLSKIKE